MKAIGAHAVASGEECLEDLAREAVGSGVPGRLATGMDGMETLSRIQEIPFADRPVVVMISGHGNIETAVKATKLGAFDFLEKPLSIQKLSIACKNALEHRRLQLENIRLRGDVESKYRIIGDSVPMKALRQQMELMAATNGRVLIYGESGTGKELVAHAIHAMSHRAEESFVEVNCAAIPEELIESELFGHLKGSFTGAHENKIGKFRKADGGSLFLDEVGDMSLRTQAKVLRALEEQRFEAVGAPEWTQVDVRVIAATNKVLEHEIERGNFREDLFYRLNVIPFHVPPLRDRREDIPLLADYFLREFTRAYGRKPKELTPAAYCASARTSLAGQRARAAKSDRAHRDSQSAGAHRRAPYPVARRRGGRRTTAQSASAVCRKCAKRWSASTSSRNWKRPTATSPARPNCWAWSAVISTGK